MADAPRDNNSIPTLLAVSSADGTTPVVLWADPTTHRLLVDLPAGTGDVVGDTASADKELVRFNGTGGKTIESPSTDNASVTATLSDNVDLTLYDATNDGNPVLAFGAASAERLTITPTYDSGAQTLDYVEFNTDVASATADKGEYRFKVDGALIATIDDGGIELADGMAFFIDTSNVLSETTLGSSVLSSSLTGVGALDSGSITSGFGSIDVGASAISTTGLITGGDLTLSADNPDIIGGDTDGVLSITADTATNEGGNIKLYGNTHATKAQDIEFYADATLVGGWDESAGTWDFNNIDGTIIGATTVAAGSFAALVATTITGSGILSIDDTTDSTSGTTGSIHTDGGLGVAKDLFALTLNAEGDTSAGDNAAIGYTATEGLILTGQGSTNDITLKNDADADVLVVPTGTTNIVLSNSIYLKEQADADGDTAGQGQIWVDTATPNVLRFTDDAGTDFFLNDATDNIRFIDFIVVDAKTDCATGTDLIEWECPFAGTIIQDDNNKAYFSAWNATAGTTGTMVVDVHLAGTTIMTTNKLDIETTETSTRTAATQPDLTTTAISAGDLITIDVDAVHTTVAKGLTVRLAIRPT